MAVSGYHLGGQLAKILGLKDCVSFSIHFEIDSAVYVDAKVLVPSEDADDLVQVMKRYKLVDADAPEEDDEPGGDIDWGDGGPLDG